MNEFRVGIVGLGRSGEVHRDAWQSLGAGTKLVAVCDDSLAIQMRASNKAFPTYDDAAEMLEQENLDAVSICTPPSSHLELAALFLGRGVPVLCEKPMTTSLGTAFRMFDSVSKTGTPFALATKYRFVPEVQQAKELIAAGEIGELLTYRVEFANYTDMSLRWNSLQDVSGGGVLIDSGCHAFDLVQFVIGPIQRVRATRLRQAQQFDVEDTALVLATGAGVTGEIFVSWSVSTGSPNYMTICGTKGTIEIGWNGCVLKQHGKTPVEIGGGYDEGVAHRNMLQAFQQAVQQDDDMWISIDSAIETVFAVEAAYRSMAHGTAIDTSSTKVRVHQEPIR